MYISIYIFINLSICISVYILIKFRFLQKCLPRYRLLFVWPCLPVVDYPVSVRPVVVAVSPLLKVFADGDDLRTRLIMLCVCVCVWTEELVHSSTRKHTSVLVLVNCSQVTIYLMFKVGRSTNVSVLRWQQTLASGYPTHHTRHSPFGGIVPCDIFIYTYIHIHIYIYTYIFAYIFTYIYIYIFKLDICIYIYIYPYTLGTPVYSL